jgi:cyclophilin family peptidyl-prolyl cis-trans isomerase
MHRMWGRFLLVAAAFLFAGSLGFAQSAAPEAKPVTKPAVKAAKKGAKKVEKIEVAELKIKSGGKEWGTIRIKFFPDKAPGHVKNFKDLAKKGFYDGTTFHRVIPGFMIQGGDPNSKGDDRSKHGTGGPGYTIKAEFNDTPHKRGIVSMARSSDPNSAGSQFFIVVKDSNFLDRQYTAFGQVLAGMDVADKIVGAPRDGNDNPNEKIVIEKVTLKELAQ